MTRIAFLLSLTEQWAGGISYYENLLKAIRVTASKKDVTLIGIFSGQTTHQHIASLLDEIYEIPIPNSREKISIKISDWMRPRLHLRPFMPELAQARLLQKLKINAAFTTITPSYQRKTPIIGWVPDFQFLHMPEMFAPKHKKWLEDNAKELAIYSDAIICSSQTALNDFKKIMPEYSSKAHILQFVSGIDDSVYERNPSWICEEYGLSERFFYLPNQFWKHKNHTFVIEALKIASQAIPDIRVVTTGLLSDHRHLTYPSELVASISQNKLRENFILLGYIPRLHIYTLMRQCIALLQPSLFEGWSTSIEEAKSLGKKVLMSDIPVHREQNPIGGTYFSLDNAKSLADLMVHTWVHNSAGADFDLENKARSDFSNRFQSFGENFLKVVKQIQ